MLSAKIVQEEIDVIGDVHGELEALLELMYHLGYNVDNGAHPEGRKIVFVGDILDRGPHSVSIFYLVRELYERGVAQCILGNHELNLLRPNLDKSDKYKNFFPQKRHGNHWFRGEKERMIKGVDVVIEQELATAQNRRDILSFLKTLPIALEDEKLRIVHA